METLEKLQVIQDFEQWAAANKIAADPLGLLEYLDRKGILKQASDNKIIFECDRRKCEKCNPAGTCTHTTDIQHAANFKNENGYFMEVERGGPTLTVNGPDLKNMVQNFSPDIESGYLRRHTKKR